MEDQVASLAEAMARANHLVVLTGAGASTESGIPDFRSPGGLWDRLDPVKVASVTALRSEPLTFYRFYRERLSRLREANPNPAHYALAALERHGLLKCLITQNIDGLHQKAGSREVVEVHGSIREAHCLECRRTYPIEYVERDVRSWEDLPFCQDCGGMVKAAVVLFEEELPEAAIRRAFGAARESDLFVVIGSSLEVGPVNMAPLMAVHGGGRLALINLAPTDYDHLATWVVRGKSGEVLPQLLRQMRIDF